MSTINRALCALSILVLTSVLSFAQDTTIRDKFLRQPMVASLQTSKLAPQPKDKGFFDKPFGRGFAASTAIYWSGVLTDLATSQGKGFYEGNPRLRNSRGGLDNGKALAISGAIYALTLPFEKKYSKAMAVLRIVMGSVHFGVAGYNHWGAR